jgi:hypothetical protein
VTVGVSCTSGTVTGSPASVAPGSPQTFTVSGFSSGATCTAGESPVPAGYSADQTNCGSVTVAAGNAKTCTITNNAQATLQVSNVYSDANTAAVTVTLTCSSGTITGSPASVAPGSPQTFTVTGFSSPSTCSALETPVPSGYFQSGCFGISLSAGGVLSCTITNTVGSCTDTDGDGVCDQFDNCPNWANPAQNLPAWPVPAGDSDCDGFPDSVAIGPPNALASEAFMGTDPARHCAATPARNDEPGPAAWPVDFDDNQLANGQDLLMFAPVFGSIGPNPPYDPRFDLNGDGRINGQDLLKFAPFFGKRCSP